MNFDGFGSSRLHSPLCVIYRYLLGWAGSSSITGSRDTLERPVAFASKSLSQAQRNYPSHRLEFLALKWSVCYKFSHWLKDHVFTVWTDNNPLTHIITKP